MKKLSDNYYTYQKTVEEWFKYLDDLFNFKRLLEDYGYNVKKVQKALDKEFMYGESSFEFFVTKLNRLLDDDSLTDKVLEYGKKFIENKKIQTGLGMAQQLPTNSVYDGNLDILYFNDKEEEDMKRLTEKKIDEEDRIEALAQFLGLDEEEKEEIEVDDETLTYDGDEYLVVTEDEGYEMAKEEVRYFLEDDLGLEGVSENTQEYAIENFCNFPWKDDMHESNLMYAQDIDSENGSNGYATRLVEEAIDEKVIKEKDCFENEDGELDYEDKDELAEMLANKLDENYDSMGEWFESIYGSGWAKEMRDTLKDYIDWEALAEYIVDSDGVANTLARYDGQENEEKVNGEWFYIYRQ